MGSRPRRSRKGHSLMSKILAHTRRIAAASAASMLIAGLAHAGVELKVGGDTVAATAVTFSVSQQPVYDPVTYLPVEPARSTLYAGGIYVTRNFDSSSVKVIKHIVGAAPVPAVEITITTDGSADKQVWTLTDAVLNNYSTYTGENAQVVENFDITYKTAKLEVYNGAATKPTDSVTWEAPVPVAYTGE
ncbi:MAG: type VI secretion system tube protein Hcp [Hyphomonas sp.]|nr:type VI secretion system tube protein Hcp [Hyphomonas sp.]